jgi:hypothetical protein
MTNPKHYFTFTLVDKVTKEPVGWNSEVAETEEQAIKYALNRLSSPDADYMVDESSFKKQTDDEMEKLMWYTS